MQHLERGLQAAAEVLSKATTPHGIMALATAEVTENYARVWARDSIMAGYAGILLKDEVVIAGLRASLNTLQQHQSPLGIIPSNVGIMEEKVSYGGTAGRVDATLWYIVGVLLYVQATGDRALWAKHEQSVQLAIKTAAYWEVNTKHLIYTPLSGNWADEYPIHGYTLYDNCLRLWGLELYDAVIDDTYKNKAQEVKSTIRQNFFLSPDTERHYHPTLYSRALSDLGTLPYAAAGFNPARYYPMFDCGGNGLALLLGLYTDEQVETLVSYLHTVWQDLGHSLTPAFWPVIHREDSLWADLEMNYAYDFKNMPHHFHNGGIWPIMMGWLAQGLKHYRKSAVSDQMLRAYLDVCENENYIFSEYIPSDDFKPTGKAPLCYSAAGLVLMAK